MSKSPVDTGHPFDKRDDARVVGGPSEAVAYSAHANSVAAPQGEGPPLVVNPHPTGELARRVAATLASPRADVLGAALARRVRDVAQYEASVRCGPTGVLSAGRMMIERASPDVLDAIAYTLEVVLPPAATRWLELAEHERVPLIIGWDLRRGTSARGLRSAGSRRCVKLYVNASDAAADARARLRVALAPDVTGESPAVMGMNVTAEGIVETKLYLQSADAVTLAHGFGVVAQALASAAREERADAGGVVSFDVADGALHPRAFFVALREPPSAAGWRCVRSLPGYDPRAVAALLPFAPAPPRSMGISLHDGTWTLYHKPHDSGRAPEALEPTAIFRVGNLEVGVFVEPTEYAARAFRRTARHAVSVRVRAGTPAPQALEVLVDWFTERLRTAELAGGVVNDLADPPAPWRLVNATRSSAGLGERL